MRTSLFELTIDPQKMLRYFESVNNINSFKNNNKRKQRSTYHIHLRNYFCKLLFSLHDKMRSISVISAGHYWKVSFLFEKSKKQSSCIDIALQRHSLQKQISLAPTKICFMLPVKEFKHFVKFLDRTFILDEGAVENLEHNNSCTSYHRYWSEIN